jgi:hypothetical protein
MTSPEVRLLLALGEAESMAIVRTVSPGYALSAAARAHAVDESRLAKVWLTKLICCSRARSVMTSMSQADADVDELIR